MPSKPAALTFALLSALLGPQTAYAAESVADPNILYVTDELRLGLYDNEATTGRPLRNLTSGAKLEVLERALRSVRVRTERGDQGWVKTAYVVNDPPARRMIEPIRAENERLTEALARAETGQRAAESAKGELEAQLSSARAGIVRLPELEQEARALRETVAGYGSRVPVNWLIAAVVAAFLAGCAAGYFWLDRRVRKRFGGLRVY